jgi:predicted DNA-binding transcriptional regulator YafY
MFHRYDPIITIGLAPGGAVHIIQQGDMSMANSPNQKLRQLYLMRILMELSDEEHPMTVKDLIGQLRLCGIEAERKSLYADVERLIQFGINVETVKTNTVGYFVAQRDFELAELKLLADAVQSSRFITVKKSEGLIRKIAALGSVHQAKQLNRQVYVDGQPKSVNESVYYNVDAIHTAINENKKIGFKYFDYDANKRRVYRKDGGQYIQTPVALCWRDDAYYLIAYSAKHGGFAHYRVDRMTDVSATTEPRDAIGDFDVAEYTKKVFGMYNSEVVKAELAFAADLINVVIDRFGADVQIKKESDGWIAIRADVSASPVFLGWLLQFGGRVKILAPDRLKEAMRQLLSEATKNY